jgi:hypothetical protein
MFIGGDLVPGADSLAGNSCVVCRRSSLPEQIITDVKGSSRLRDARRSFSGVRAQFRRRTQQPLEISSHGDDYLASFSGANNNEHSVTNSISTDHSTRCVGIMKLYRTFDDV